MTALHLLTRLRGRLSMMPKGSYKELLGHLNHANELCDKIEAAIRVEREELLKCQLALSAGLALQNSLKRSQVVPFDPSARIERKGPHLVEVSESEVR